MKAISLWQPWASLVAVGAKRVETRSWGTAYRGPLAIHAAKTRDRLGKELCSSSRPFITAFTSHGLSFDKLPFGAILAVANLVDVRAAEEAYKQLDYLERAFGDYAAGRKAWMLDRVLALTVPIQWRGAMGLFEIPDDVVAAGFEGRKAWASWA